MRRKAINVTAALGVLALLLAGCVSGSSHDPLECAETLLASSRGAASEAVDAMRAAAEELPADRSEQEKWRRSCGGQPTAWSRQAAEDAPNPSRPSRATA